jgi:hypothetical protein
MLPAATYFPENALLEESPLLGVEWDADASMN